MKYALSSLCQWELLKSPVVMNFKTDYHFIFTGFKYPRHFRIFHCGCCVQNTEDNCLWWINRAIPSVLFRFRFSTAMMDTGFVGQWRSPVGYCWPTRTKRWIFSHLRTHSSFHFITFFPVKKMSTMYKCFDYYAKKWLFFLFCVCVEKRILSSF